MGEVPMGLNITVADLDEESRRGSNLLLYGAPTSNSVFARYADALPIAVGDRSITLAGKTYEAPGVAAIAIFPHPESARYVAVHAGTTPDAITWGSHLHMQLLPDYIAYDGGELLGWGFWDNDWNPQE